MRRSEAGCASGSFSAGTGGNLPRPAPRQAARAGVRVSFAGRSAVLRRGRCEPALLRVAPKMQLPCRRLRRPRRVFRHGPAAFCSAAMALRPRCLYRMAGDASLAPATTSLAATVRLRSRTLLGPVVPREPFRRSHEAAALPRPGCHLQPILLRPGISVSIRPRCLECGDVANPCLPVHHPDIPECRNIPEAAPGRRQPQATATAPLPDSRRLSGPPRSGRNGSRPTTIRWSLGGAEYTTGTKAAPEKKC